METTQSFGIQFLTRENKDKNSGLTIYVRITVNGSSVEISLKQTIVPEYWNSIKGTAKGNNNEMKELNQFLNKVRTRISNIYREMMVEGELPTAIMIKNKFLGIEEQGRTLLTTIAYHNKMSIDSLSPNTLKHYSTTEKYVKEFLLKQFSTSDVFLTRVNYQFITDFEYFLRNRQPTDHQQTLNNNGVMKHNERLRKVVKLARRLEWINKIPFENYQVKYKKFDRDFLEEDELQNLEKTKFKLGRLEFTKDLFIFGCYTGLAYIDTFLLKPEDIHKGIDGNQWIITSRKKTDTPLRIPLLPKAFEIVEKYRNNPRSKFNGTLFLVISNQKLNSYLKEIADLCGISKNLTFHLARHTFATTVTLSNGVPIETVSKILGHTSIKTTQIYGRILDARISSDMLNLQSKLALKNLTHLKVEDGLSEFQGSV